MKLQSSQEIAIANNFGTVIILWFCIWNFIQHLLKFIPTNTFSFFFYIDGYKTTSAWDLKSQANSISPLKED
ncbi:MAG: hypothetical protein DSM106950_02370 [Stigonema ocellatum SAG 48.90 = DSM 106950]|nr:hypothetical protein [Stigonema ocellatum SAG 48.90 = DSM 106950]